MSRGREVVLLLLAALVLLFAGLGRADLFNPDEPREAEMAREMRVTGDHTVPHLNGEPFLEKPPLFYWGVVSAYRICGGPGETAARLVPALAALITVLLTFRMARDLLGERAALVAALVLLTGFEFFWIARRSLIDMPLTLAVLLACFGLHRVCTASAGKTLGGLALGALGLAAALMLKGIVGAAIPGLAVLSWLLLRRDLSPVWRRGLLPAVLVAFVPVGAWVILLHRALGEGAVHEFVVVNNVMRFTGGASKGHDQPFWYYLPVLLTDLAPWSMVLPAALVRAFRSGFGRVAAAGGGESARGGETAVDREIGEGERAVLRDLLAWFLVPLVFLSIASTKRGLYLLPMYPAAAMLLAWWLCRSPRRAWLWLLWGVAGALGVAVIVVSILVRPAALAAPIATAAALLLALGIALGPVRRGDGRGAALGIAAVSGTALLAAIVVATPRIVNGGTSARPAGQALRELTARGASLVLYAFKEGALGGVTFYSGRTYANEKSPDGLRRRLENGQLLLMRGADLEAARRALPFPIEEAGRWRCHGFPGEGDANDYVLTRPAAVAGGGGAPP
jgi:4-amino-4-deoxy-L-arabinose transferase-like glycosyltransferase